jgi:prepilin-type N-terminal cleavage/methylation domain-containing protein
MKKAFTLTELLVVVAVMSALTTLIVPALSGLRTAGNITNSAYEIASILQRARTYAMTHNTYVWVGFHEESASPTASANTPGNGRVLIAMAASIDGTQIFDNSATTASLPSSRIVAVEKLLCLNNVHLADLAAPAGGNNPTSLDGRPDHPYTGDSSSKFRVNSESSAQTPHPLNMLQYTFNQTVRFSPNGEASINGETDLPRIGEIGLCPTQGSRVDSSNKNVAAIQFTGAGGNVEIYRR